MLSEQTLGHIAFNAYKADKQGKTYDAKPIPAWEAVGDDVRHAWEAAAKAVKEHCEFLAMLTNTAGKQRLK